MVHRVKGRSVPTFAIVAIASLACSGPPGEVSAFGAPTPGDVQPTVKKSAICGLTELPNGLVEHEIYMFPAMNNKLAYYPDFAAELGFDTVTDCESARAFMRGYAAYRDDHPFFDADEPRRPSEEEEPAPPIQEEPPSIELPKVLNGMEVVNTPVVQIKYRSHSSGHSSFDHLTRLTEPHRCSGTFIAKNWILTAAHCLSASSVDHCLREGTPIDECEPSRMHYMEWDIRVSLSMSGNRMTWYEIRKVLGLGYIHEKWAGLVPSQNPDLCPGDSCYNATAGARHDVALIYIPDDTRLPPEVEADGAKRLSILPPDGTEVMDFYGWGTPRRADDNESVLRTNGSGSRPRYTVETDVVRATKVMSTDTIPCPGDSGGPLVRNFDIMTNRGRQTVQAIIAIDSHGNPGKNCNMQPGPAGDFSRLARVDLNFDFIEEKIRRWPGFSKFECTKRESFGSPLPEIKEVAECWGKPCNHYGAPSPQAPLGCGMTEFCSRPGREFVSRGINRCDTCGTANNCDCVVGQCIPKP